jgi:hypothetical protein
MINATLTISVPLGQSGGLLQPRTAPKNPQTLSQSSGAQSTEQMVNALADALIQGMFKKKWDGGTFDASNPMMKMVADYMDQHHPEIGRPDDANGHVRNWNDELKEDNYLDKNELSEFTKGLKGFLSDLLNGVGSLMSSLGSMAGGLAGSAVGGPLGSMAGSAIGGAVGNAAGNVFSGLGNQFGGAGGFGGCGFGSAGAGGFGGGMNPMDLSSMGLAGFNMGNSFAMHVGKTAIDSIDINSDAPKGGNSDMEKFARYSFSDEDKGVAEAIGKYMDNHTDRYGEQPKGGWANRIEKGKDFNFDEISHFKQAMSDVKGIMNGQSTGDSQLDSDAMMLSNAVVFEAMNKVAA